MDLTRHEAMYAGDLSVQARLNEIDRSLTSLRFRHGTFKWLFLPILLLALLAMIAGLVLGYGETAPMVGGILALLGSVVGFGAEVRSLSEEIESLAHERASYPAGRLREGAGGKDLIGEGGDGAADRR